MFPAALQVVIDLPEHMRGTARRSSAAAPAWRTPLAPGACDRPASVVDDRVVPSPSSSPRQPRPVVQESLQAARCQAGAGAASLDPSIGQHVDRSAAHVDAADCAMHAGTALQNAPDLAQTGSYFSAASGKGGAAQCSGSDQGLSQAHLEAVCGFDVGGWRLLEIVPGASRPCRAWRTSSSAPRAAPPQVPMLPQSGCKALSLNPARLGSPSRRLPEDLRPDHPGLAARNLKSSPAASAQPKHWASPACSAEAGPGVAQERPAAGPAAPKQAAPASASELDPPLRTCRVGNKASLMKGRAALAAKPAQTGLRNVELLPTNPKLAALSSLGQSLLGLNADAALVAAFLRAREAAEVHEGLPCSHNGVPCGRKDRARQEKCSK